MSRQVHLDLVKLVLGNADKLERNGVVNHQLFILLIYYPVIMRTEQPTKCFVPGEVGLVKLV